MHNRNSGEVLSRLYPRLRRSRATGRRVQSVVGQRGKPPCTRPIWITRPEPLLTALSAPSDSPRSTWAASPPASAASNRYRGPPQPPTASYAAAPSATPSAVFVLWRSGRPSSILSAWPQTFPSARRPPAGSAGPSRARWSRQQRRRTTRGLGHGIRCTHRINTSWSPRAAPSARAIPPRWRPQHATASCAPAPAGAAFGYSTPSPPYAEPAAARKDAPSHARWLLSCLAGAASLSRATECRWARGHAASSSAAPWTEVEVHSRGRSAIGGPEREEELDLEADCGLLSRQELRDVASAVLYETESQDDGLDRRDGKCVFYFISSHAKGAEFLRMFLCYHEAVLLFTGRP